MISNLLPFPIPLSLPIPFPKMKFTSSLLFSLSLIFSSQLQVQAFPSFTSRDLSVDSSKFVPFAKRDSIPDPLNGRRSPARDFSKLSGEKRAVQIVPDEDHPYIKPGKNDQRS